MLQEDRRQFSAPILSCMCFNILFIGDSPLTFDHLKLIL